MKKNIFFISVIFIIIFGLILVFNISKKTLNKTKNQTKTIKIVTPLFPLYDFAKKIGGDYVEVSLLLPPGVEAHSFEPKPSDIAKISGADIFIYTGKFMEPWVTDILAGIKNDKLETIDSSIGVKTETAVFHDKNEMNNLNDPHIWLDFDNDKIIIKASAQQLIKKDNINKNYYSQNLLNYQNKLSNLDSKYKNTLAKCQTNEIIYGGHYAFGYLANRYGLNYLAIQGMSPDAEPSAQDLMKIIKQIQKDNVKYIFYEELNSPKIAQTLANETNAKLLLLNAAHNITKNDFINNISFLDIMEENLVNLKEGLICN